MWQPLKNIRVADFSPLLPGPFATLALADLGADVVKIEPPGGDGGRHLPSSLFRMANRNKRSLVLDLKKPGAQDIIRRLAQWADIAMEAFRPGVAARLGIDPAALQAINPRLIHCALSGYGQTGPANMAPGHDLNYLAAAGTMALSGHWDEPPRRSAIPVADLAGGSFATIAILAALHERAQTGRGRALDLSLSESALAFTAIRHGLDLDAPSQDHLWPTNDLFETADGALALGIVEEVFWRNFLRATADLAPDLAAPAWATEPGRRADGTRVKSRLAALLRQHTTAEWMARFSAHDVPAQPRLTPHEASRTPQVTAREMVMESGGERHIPFPVRVDGARGAALHHTAPAPGADRDAILGELGYTPADIAGLKETGVLGDSNS